MEVEAFLTIVARTPETPMGTIVATRDYYVEIGRRMEFPVYPAVRTLATLGTAGPLCMQATLRDIKIRQGLRRKGLFAALVRYLLERDGAVRLECVQPDWLKRRLAASPLWVRQDFVDREMLEAERGDAANAVGPTYARFALNVPFTLF